MTQQFEAIVGRYVTIDVNGTAQRIYFEEAGRAPRFCCFTRQGPTIVNGATS